MASPYVSTLFGQSVKSVLDGWTALQLAVSHGFGGPDSQEKAEWMVYAIETWFKENANIQSDELEDFLTDVMNAEFDMVIDDNSLPQVAQMICKYYRLCREGLEAEVRQSIASQPKAALQGCTQGDSNQEVDGEEAENGEAMACCSGGNAVRAAGSQSAPAHPVQPAQQNNTDGEDMEVEDGWEVVKRGRKK
ncbi:pre-rRNA-processing protein TSR2 homolog [Haliotis rubra]|uniref:pre-rRNA-processing protein TSR2 homolog n=1 Tax=Haliotis rubra TaxID=36100 RepID=UPI001EE55F2C|nr:pre-rRNA-processing protein TSR2 homolog [Haliotis rubra]